jgi:hypothetical protein
MAPRKTKKSVEDLSDNDEVKSNHSEEETKKVSKSKSSKKEKEHKVEENKEEEKKVEKKSEKKSEKKEEKKEEKKSDKKEEKKHDDWELSSHDAEEPSSKHDTKLVVKKTLNVNNDEDSHSEHSDNSEKQDQPQNTKQHNPNFRKPFNRNQNQNQNQNQNYNQNQNQNQNQHKKPQSKQLTNSAINFSYGQYRDLTHPVNELDSKDLVKILIVRAHDNNQKQLCETMKQTLRAMSLECNFPEVTNSHPPKEREYTTESKYPNKTFGNSNKPYKTENNGEQKQHFKSFTPKPKFGSRPVQTTSE